MSGREIIKLAIALMLLFIAMWLWLGLAWYVYTIESADVWRVVFGSIVASLITLMGVGTV